MESTEQEQAAESDALFSSMGEGAIVTDENAYISRVNNVALSILGYKHGELIGKWYPGTVKAEYEDGTIVPNLERPITRAFLTGKAVRARMHYRRKDGSRITADLSVAPILIDGEPKGAIQVFRDITQEVALEKAKDEFISLASHQLRTPATGVKQYTSMLMEGYAGEVSKPQMAMLQSIYDSNERQITIVNDLLKVAHVDAGQVQIEKKMTDLVQLISDIISEQKHKFTAHRQKIVFTYGSGTLYAYVDPKNLRMVIENIIDNASKYTPDKRTITAELKKRKDAVDISIIDQGVGIPKADIPKVFQKFSRLRNPLSMMVSGTGLGLYWANKIILLHGGTISIKSAVGKGTTFTVSLPNKKKRPGSRANKCA